MQNELGHLPCHRRRILGVLHRSGLVGSAMDSEWAMTLCWGAKGASNHSPLNTVDSVSCSASPVCAARDELPQLALRQSWLHLEMRKLQMFREMQVTAWYKTKQDALLVYAPCTFPSRYRPTQTEFHSALQLWVKHKGQTNYRLVFSLMVQEPYSDLGRLIAEVLRSHTIRHTHTTHIHTHIHNWMHTQTRTQTRTHTHTHTHTKRIGPKRRHTTFLTEEHPPPGGIRTLNPSKRTELYPLLRPCETEIGLWAGSMFNLHTFWINSCSAVYFYKTRCLLMIELIISLWNKTLDACNFCLLTIHLLTKNHLCM